MDDYVAVGYDVAGNIRAFTVGTLECCKSAAKVYRRTKNGMRVYPIVKVMTLEEWDAAVGKSE